MSSLLLPLCFLPISYVPFAFIVGIPAYAAIGIQILHYSRHPLEEMGIGESFPMIAAATVALGIDMTIYLHDSEPLVQGMLVWNVLFLAHVLRLRWTFNRFSNPLTRRLAALPPYPLRVVQATLATS